MKTSGRKEKKPSFAALDSDRMATTITAREFETQFKSLYRPLCLFALRYTERTDEAEDIVQQAFADVWGGGGYRAASLRRCVGEGILTKLLYYFNRVGIPFLVLDSRLLLRLVF